MAKKYIITKKHGKIKHFVFPGCTFHETFARDNGFDYFSEVIESGIIQDKRCLIITCKDKKHLNKKENNFTNTISPENLKGRKLETLLAYGIRREGD